MTPTDRPDNRHCAHANHVRTRTPKSPDFGQNRALYRVLREDFAVHRDNLCVRTRHWVGVSFLKTLNTKGTKYTKGGVDSQFCALLSFVIFVYFVFRKLFSQNLDAHPSSLRLSNTAGHLRYNEQVVVIQGGFPHAKKKNTLASP